jgi:hypothetical protein
MDFVPDNQLNQPLVRNVAKLNLRHRSAVAENRCSFAQRAYLVHPVSHENDPYSLGRQISENPEQCAYLFGSQARCRLIQNDDPCSLS